MNCIKKLLGLLKSEAAAQGNQFPGKAGPSRKDELVARFGHLYRPALQMVPDRSGGFSRLGGLPQMPDDLTWPVWEGKPQAFLAQLSLAELHAVLPSFLPAFGYLFFFYDQDQGVWGFDPKDLGGWRVLYSTQDCQALASRPAPDGLGAEFIYAPKSVRPRRIDLLPDSDALSAPEFVWNRDGEAYSELRLTAYGEDRNHQVLGFPMPVQNADMEVECQLATHGIYVGNAEGYSDARVPGLKAGAKDWKLLLQLDTDDDTGWMWGDMGTLYFWVREQDARVADFSKVWMVFQCC